MLAFPSEPSNARAAMGFKYRNPESGAAHVFRLSVSYGNECAICNALHEAVTEGVG